MLKIRLRRTGRKNEPHYQVVVAPHTNPVKGNFITKIGWLNPTTRKYEIDQEAAIKWPNNGAQPSPRVATLLIGLKIKHPLVKLAPQKNKAPKKKSAEGKTPAAPTNTEEAAEVTQEEVDNKKPSNDNEEA